MGITRRVKHLMGSGNEVEPDPESLPRNETGKPYPPVPDGWTLGPPDYVGIGVQKGGTTWWWKLIAQHPDVVGELKETHHLTRLGWRPLFDEDRESYYGYFPRPAGKIAGEWTPQYMSVPGMVDTIKAVAPQAKLLVLLRDPVERYRSGVGHWQKLKERRGKRLNLRAGRKDAFERSFYGFSLSRYVEAFGAEQILIQQFEKCLQDPAGQYGRTLRFLGLPDWLPDEESLGTPRNVSQKRPSPGVLDEPDDLVASMEDDVHLLLTLAPDFDLSLWPNFRHLAPHGAGSDQADE